MASRAHKFQSLDECFRNSKDESLIFGVDLSADPPYAKYWFNVLKDLHSKCARALPIAGPDDIVLLSGSLEPQYLGWLKELGLGPGEVVAYNASHAKESLPALISKNPAPLLKAIQRIGKKPVYVPFFAGSEERKLAENLGMDFFGCNEDITLSYYNKESFKERCKRLGIQTVEGFSHEVKMRSSGLDLAEFANVLSALLGNYSSLMVRGALSGGGASVYKVEPVNIKETIQKLSANRQGGSFLIEPYLNVIASPNDQWCVTRQGRIVHLEITAQLFKGLEHAGNLKGQYFSHRVFDGITRTSEKIVKAMAEEGYRGIVGIDYIVADEGIFPIENNARLNGSTFAIGIVEKLSRRTKDINVWKFYRTEITPCSFSDLRSRLGELLYDGSSVNSVFPFDADSLNTSGAVTFLMLAEDMYHLQFLEAALAEMGLGKKN
jgi:hypothetical protein